MQPIYCGSPVLVSLWLPADPKVSALVSLWQGLKAYISNKFPADAHGAGLRTNFELVS